MVIWERERDTAKFRDNWKIRGTVGLCPCLRLARVIENNSSTIRKDPSSQNGFPFLRYSRRDFSRRWPCRDRRLGDCKQTKHRRKS